MIDVNDFKQEVECIYKDEKYSVRDNGAIFRHPRDGKRPRKYDNFWTFGKANDKHGYMEIASVRVHIIVATAFHGTKPTKEYVVDHIDTNRRNNRPNNLRWVTRLENALENPITRKRIIMRCGSIEAFFGQSVSVARKRCYPRFQLDENRYGCRSSSQQRAIIGMGRKRQASIRRCFGRMGIWSATDFTK